MSKAQKDPENNINGFLNEGHIGRMEQYLEANLGLGVRIGSKSFRCRLTTKVLIFHLGYNMVFCRLDRNQRPLLVVAKQAYEQEGCKNVVF